jgi:mycothiol synthase
MTLPDGYEARRPTSGDLDAIAAVLVADDMDDAGLVILDADFLRGQWNRTGFALGTDAWVVSSVTEGVVAYGQAFAGQPGIVESWGVVHPRQRARGIGSALLDRIGERADQLTGRRPSGRFRHSINTRDRAAAALLRARGLSPVRYFHHMQIDLTDPVEQVRAPKGITLTDVHAPTDLRVVHGVLTAAFAEEWSHQPEPYDRWADEQLRDPAHDATLWSLAWAGQRPVGALTASVWKDRGWVDEVGVISTRRGEGIGTALLRRAFYTFAQRGLPRVMLNVDVDNPTGAPAVYERAGMRVVRRWEVWERHGGATA